MKDVFSDADTARVGLYQSFLESAGIVCFIRNFNEGGGYSLAGIPTLCITHDADFTRAMDVIAQSTANAPVMTGRDWRCPKCGEEVPGSFGACWNCDVRRPA